MSSEDFKQPEPNLNYSRNADNGYYVKKQTPLIRAKARFKRIFLICVPAAHQICDPGFTSPSLPTQTDHPECLHKQTYRRTPGKEWE